MKNKNLLLIAGLGVGGYFLLSSQTNDIDDNGFFSGSSNVEQLTNDSTPTTTNTSDGIGSSEGLGTSSLNKKELNIISNLQEVTTEGFKFRVFESSGSGGRRRGSVATISESDVSGVNRLIRSGREAPDKTVVVSKKRGAVGVIDNINKVSRLADGGFTSITGDVGFSTPDRSVFRRSKKSTRRSDDEILSRVTKTLFRGLL